MLGLQGGQVSFLETIKSAGLISVNSFTLKFSKSGKSGSLVLGDVADQNSTTCNMLLRSMKDFAIDLNSIKVGEKEVSVKSKAVLDSGTAPILLP